MSQRLSDQLIAQWHPSKNGAIKAADMAPGSHRIVWWLCKKGHSYDRAICNQATMDCPYCSGKRILSGFNDLATLNPSLAAQWDFSKNSNIDINVTSPNSHKKAWWQCSLGHSWEAQIKSRHQRGLGCPICSRSKVAVGINDFLTTHPIIAGDWHPTKNGNRKPNNYLSGSNAKVWWLGSCGHEWESKITSRTLGGGCLICSGRLVISGINDLATLKPDIAQEWHPTKNKGLLASDVTVSSARKVWWQCSLGHEWLSPPHWRASGSNNCPYCSNALVLSGYNDLASHFPKLSKEWVSELNEKTPFEVSTGSGYKAWWECDEKHRWLATVNDRVGRKRGCPQCWARTYVSKPETEILELLTSLRFTVEQSNRTVLGRNRELDLYVPDKKFGIEFNGLYWHSEAQGKGKGDQYHKAKYDAATAAGIQLVQIWEDDWRDRKPAVMRALAHKLGVTSMLAQVRPELSDVTSKVFARKTKAVLLTTQQAQVFLEANHFQGFASGSYYVGLEGVDGVLRAVMVLKREADGVLNIVRYATAGSVTGGFTKLLSHATKTYNPSSFITFADHTISDGGLYEKHGFVVDKLIAPDYMYVVRGERKHKFGYRLKKFRNDPNLLWEEGLTERELAALNNLHRIWDAGKTRYRLAVR
jgi:hypothetical protein